MTASLLMAVCPGYCVSKGWQLLRTDNFSDGLAIFALTFVTPEHGWALTPSQLLETTDGGATWTTRLESEEAERSFGSLLFVNPATGFIVGTQSKGRAYTVMILRTNDGGATWQEQQADVAPEDDLRASPRLHSISFCDSNTGWAVGEGLILHTSDGGQSWETQRRGNKEERLFSVACESSERAWAVGQQGLVVQTTDGGRNWDRQSVGIDATFVRVRFFGDDGWIMGGRGGQGALLHKRAGEVKWERLKLDAPEVPLDIYLNDRRGWLVGTTGLVSHTEDGGQTWWRERVPTNNDLTSLFFITPQQGWAGGSKRTLLRYSD
ncbi:MAG TPA: YCF48-related protein [Pyrinomonadaceae bacterium]